MDLDCSDRCIRLDSKTILEKLAGFIAFVFQFRREMFSLLHHFYVFTEKLPGEKTIKLPGYVADELRPVALHLPMGTCDAGSLRPCWRLTPHRVLEELCVPRSQSL